MGMRKQGNHDGQVTLHQKPKDSTSKIRKDGRGRNGNGEKRERDTTWRQRKDNNDMSPHTVSGAFPMSLTNL